MIHFFRIRLSLWLSPLLLLIIFLLDSLHYVCNQSLLIIRTTLILLESDYDPLNPDLGRFCATSLDGEFLSFHLVLVLLLIDLFYDLVFNALYNQGEADEKLGFHS